MSEEYLSIVNKIITNRKFQKLKQETHHHTTNRFDHCLAVSYKSYLICKRLNLDYESAAKAALLHDFFFDEEFKNMSRQTKLVKHYEYSLKNAKKLSKLNKKEENIIASHMFPIGGKTPRCLESIIVNAVDDQVAIRENLAGKTLRLKNSLYVMALVCISFLWH